MSKSKTKGAVAYGGSQKLKDELLAKLRAHREADTLVKGTYWAKANGGFKGRPVGCLLEESTPRHERYESEWGIPAQLAWLEDGIFETLPDDLSQAWPERFMGAIEPGADLSHVWPRFAIWLMVDGEWGVVNATNEEKVKDICHRVANGYGRMVEGSNPLSDKDADQLARAARAAWAARDAGAAWAARDAGAAFTIASADKLVELLVAAPVAVDRAARTVTGRKVIPDA